MCCVCVCEDYSEFLICFGTAFFSPPLQKKGRKERGSDIAALVVHARSVCEQRNAAVVVRVLGGREMCSEDG